MNFIIDKHMADPQYGGGYLKAIKSLGHDVIVINYSPFRDISGEISKIDPEKSYIAIGSLLFIRDISKRDNIISFSGDDTYLFSSYSSAMDQSLLLSKSRIYTTIGRMRDVDHIRQLVTLFGSKIFIRPNRWDKVFSGQILDLDDDIAFNGFLSMNRSINDNIVVVDKVVDIKEEYRLYVSSEKGIITASSYDYIERGGESRENIPEGVIGVAERAISSLQYHIADEIFVIDVAGVNIDSFLEYRVVEINAASTSGPYDCDCEKIIQTMIELLSIE